VLLIKKDKPFEKRIALFFQEFQNYLTNYD